MNSLIFRIPSSGISSTLSVWRLLVLALVSLLTACGSLPPRGEVPPSRAFTASAVAGTALARVAESSRPPGEARPSGFQLLPVGEFAFDARVACRVGPNNRWTFSTTTSTATKPDALC